MSAPPEMMKLEELDHAKWAAAWAELPAERREVYWHPAYAMACAAWERAAPVCLFARSAGGGVLLYPYLAHPIPGEPAAWDAQTAYGYGGPLFAGEWTNDERAAALLAVGEHLRERGAVAEFVRCHTEWVDGAELAAAGFKAFQVRTNVEHVAGPKLTEGWAPSVNRNLRKAMAAGLTGGVAEGPAAWGEFERLYAATAQRLNMAASYRFDAAYFRALANVPGVRLVRVEADGVAVAGAVVFVGGRLAHYHLGASDFAYADRRPNDYLYLAMAQAARDAGCERIVWGGGMSNDPADTLFRFKSHFGAIRRAVYCAGRVIDPAKYGALCDAWRARNAGREGRMFLLYRA